LITVKRLCETLDDIYFHLQARENPEPVFDLFDCGLKTVPSGIYSLCKVFRKEALYLQVIIALNLRSYSLD